MIDEEFARLVYSFVQVSAAQAFATDALRKPSFALDTGLGTSWPEKSEEFRIAFRAALNTVVQSNETLDLMTLKFSAKWEEHFKDWNYNHNIENSGIYHALYYAPILCALHQVETSKGTSFNGTLREAK